jgi:hypothetical protein
MITQECTILRQEPTFGLQEPSQIPAQETGFGEGPIGVLILLALISLQQRRNRSNPSPP